MSTYSLNNVNYSYTVGSGIASVASSSAIISGSVDILAKFTVSNMEYTVTSIEDFAFHVKQNITNVTIPNTITSIGIHVFELCTSLKSITIPSSVTTIGNNAFNGCSTLLKIIIQSNLANIKNALGNFNRAGLSITFDYSGPIPDGMCYYCTNISSVIIGQNITSIGSQAFYYCSSLTNIKIPSSVTSIGASAFEGTTTLLNVYFLGNIPTIVGSNFNKVDDTAYYIQGATNTSSLTMFTNTTSLTSLQMYTLIGYIYPAPVITSVVPGDGKAYINFTQSLASSDEAPAITNYAYSIDGTNFINFSPTQITSPLQITGLTNEQTYSFTIKAYNSFYSSPSNTVSILVSSPLPIAPVITSVSYIPNSVKIYFTQETETDSLITSYKYSVDNGETYTSTDVTTSPLIINGLKSGIKNSIILKANNGQDSAASNTFNFTFFVSNGKKRA